MNKKVLAVIAIVFLALVFWSVKDYNQFTTQEESVENAWSEVQNQYQRRSDLIPNLVNTVKGYASHERQTLEGVIKARSNATSIRIDPKKLTPEELSRFQEAQGELSAALGKLLMLKEQYPNLKADQQFTTLQIQLEGTENRITVARMDFNKAAQLYNTNIRKFPALLVAKLFGFEKRPYFEAAADKQDAPEVQF